MSEAEAIGVVEVESGWLVILCTLAQRCQQNRGKACECCAAHTSFTSYGRTS